MQIKVDETVEISKIEEIGTNNVNAIECEFELSEKFNNLIPVAIFTNNKKSYKVNIIKQKCLIPHEVLKNEGFLEIGVYGFVLNGQELVKRYSPLPAEIQIKKGSYKEGQESVDASPNSFEYYLTECKKIKDSIGAIEKMEALSNTELEDLINNQIF